mgnify:FL=1|tara:strand:+ start:1479 stop:2639 length:1161 start_codon:yes stop_codon:yes gene_type:complete
MLAQYKETGTTASRVIYINSKDATAIMGDNRSDFDFTLEEPIVVPNHHNILLSVYSAEIPYSFYNFRNGINCKIDYATTAYNTPAAYDAAGKLTMGAVPLGQTLTIPEGNYNAVELAALLTAGIAGLEVLYDANKLKFSFRNLNKGTRITLALRNGQDTGTPEAPGEDMNEELGFDWFNILGDPFVEMENVGLTPNYYGYSNPTLDVNGNPIPGPGTDNNRQGPFFVKPSFYLYSDDVADLTNSVRSLFMRTNLSTTSVLDSHIGGGFSNILTRVPIKADPGQVINIDPINGNVHKLLLKLKAITNIAIRLTNQKNETINLNGLDFDISLKLEFVEEHVLKEPSNVRETLYQESQKFAEERALQIEEQEKKLKQLSKKKKKKKNKQ